MFEELRVRHDAHAHPLTSKRSTEYYYDFDLMTPREARAVALKLVESMPIEHTKVDFIVAPALGGIVPAYFVADWCDIPAVVIDKQGYVRGGTFTEGSTYLIIDDVVSTYREVERCRTILEGYDYRGTMAYIYRGVGDPREDTIVLARKEPEHAWK